MRVIIVSNRLPVTFTTTEHGYSIKSSIGGLAKGLNAFLAHYTKNNSLEYLWVGWPGVNLGQQQHKGIKQQLKQLNCLPITIDENIMENFYTGFCNKTLWPLFHYLAAYFSYEESSWEVYKKVNQAFCETIANTIKPGDIIWIHDYHLLLLPYCLRQRIPNVTIGHFLHIPFPSFEIFQFLPKQCRTEILNGILGADVVGFHTHEYSQHFIKCVVRMIGCDYNVEHVIANDHLVKVDVYPMGVDLEQTRKLLGKKSIAKLYDSILQKVNRQKIILSIDRLDYTKGIVNRLYAYEQFLATNPKWHEKVVLLLIVAPSRENVIHYGDLKRQIDELVGNINGKFGSVEWAPILYQYKSFSTDELVAVYAASDVALVTPLTDGMNLIAKEYLAAKVKTSGVLILSETAGAAKELMDAIIVNPNSSIEMAAAISQALEMEEEEKSLRLTTMHTHIKRYNVIKWGTNFINDLIAMQGIQKNFSARFIQSQHIKEILTKYQNSNLRLLIFDYDGTLVPINKDYKAAATNSYILGLLTSLAANPQNHVVIVSGRTRQFLDKWLKVANLTIIAEHGAWIKEHEQWSLSKFLDPNFKSSILVLLESFMDKLPGSSIEEKDFSLVWHYRNADSEKASQTVKEAIDTLQTLTANSELQVLQGRKVVEVKYASVNKGIVEQLIAQHDYGFILGIGDDVTDEDLFKVIPPQQFSIKVGAGASHARFNIRTQADVVQLLANLSDLTNFGLNAN